MKLKRKILALVMSAALILTMVPAMVFAEDAPGAAARKPVDAYLSCSIEQGPIGEAEPELVTADSSIYVTYDDGSEVEFLFGVYPIKDQEGNDITVEGFLREGGDPANELDMAYAGIDYDNQQPIQEGANSVWVWINIPYLDTDAEGEEAVTGEIFYKEHHLWARVNRPLEVRFEPADGFTLTGRVGYNYLDEEDFYGEGNTFVVVYETRDDPEVTTPAIGSYEAEYKYVDQEGVEPGFYDNGNPEYERFELTEGFECFLQKGMNEAELIYYAYVEGQEDPDELPFKVNIDAQKYDAYTDIPVYGYTGSVIKPKFKVYNSDDDLVPATEYTFTAPSNKKMGWYDVTINFKDTDNYVESVVGTYGIGPKAPKLSKVVRGKKSLTVQWKRLTKAQLKNIDGMYIEIATDKDFWNGYKRIKLNKNAVKKGKRVIKKLKKNKKYYVRMYAYKNITQNGEKFPMDSNFSKVIIKKTK